MPCDNLYPFVGVAGSCAAAAYHTQVLSLIIFWGGLRLCQDPSVGTLYSQRRICRNQKFCGRINNKGHSFRKGGSFKWSKSKPVCGISVIKNAPCPLPEMVSRLGRGAFFVPQTVCIVTLRAGLGKSFLRRPCRKNWGAVNKKSA